MCEILNGYEKFRCHSPVKFSVYLIIILQRSMRTTRYACLILIMYEFSIDNFEMFGQ
jgi:hypothetical protein